MSSSWREASSGMLTLTNVGEPPPLYSAEVDGQDQQDGLPVSVSWEPPPMYDVAIVPKPYEVSVEQWRIQDFPEEAQTPKEEGGNLLFDNIFPKTAWKWRSFGPGASLASPLPDPPMSI